MESDHQMHLKTALSQYRIGYSSVDFLIYQRTEWKVKLNFIQQMS